jgi:hypothetical protein
MQTGTQAHRQTHTNWQKHKPSTATLNMPGDHCSEPNGSNSITISKKVNQAPLLSICQATIAPNRTVATPSPCRRKQIKHASEIGGMCEHAQTAMCSPLFHNHCRQRQRRSHPGQAGKDTDHRCGCQRWRDKPKS